jgi:hypothetical protein
MKKAIFYVSICVVILAVIGILLYIQISNKVEKGIYIITTDSQFTTLLNDGGSHINIYYKIDLENKLIKKYEDRYIGFKGYKYKDKLIYEKYIDNKLNTEIKYALADLLDKNDIRNEDNYAYYTIKSEDGNIKKIFNGKSIDRIKAILNKVDEL